MTKQIETAIEAKLAEWNIGYKALFVPQSASRNSGNKERSLNWRVSFYRDGATIATDYVQGIGHVPGRKQGARLTIDRDNADKEAAEYGRCNGARKLPLPSAASVLYCLNIDASVNDASCFEDWAADCGYDTDSREAERIYNACKVIARDYCRVFSRAQRQELTELLQDY